MSLKAKNILKAYNKQNNQQDIAFYKGNELQVRKTKVNIIHNPAANNTYYKDYLIVVKQTRNDNKKTKLNNKNIQNILNNESELDDEQIEVDPISLVTKSFFELIDGGKNFPSIVDRKIELSAGISLDNISYDEIEKQDPELAQAYRLLEASMFIHDFNKRKDVLTQDPQIEKLFDPAVDYDGSDFVENAFKLSLKNKRPNKYLLKLYRDIVLFNFADRKLGNVCLSLDEKNDFILNNIDFDTFNYADDKKIKYNPILDKNFKLNDDLKKVLTTIFEPDKKDIDKYNKQIGKQTYNGQGSIDCNLYTDINLQSVKKHDYVKNIILKPLNTMIEITTKQTSDVLKKFLTVLTSNMSRLSLFKDKDKETIANIAYNNLIVPIYEMLKNRGYLDKQTEIIKKEDFKKEFDHFVIGDFKEIENDDNYPKEEEIKKKLINENCKSLQLSRINKLNNNDLMSKIKNNILKNNRYTDEQTEKKPTVKESLKDENQKLKDENQKLKEENQKLKEENQKLKIEVNNLAPSANNGVAKNNLSDVQRNTIMEKEEENLKNKIGSCCSCCEFEEDSWVEKIGSCCGCCGSLCRNS